MARRFIVVRTQYGAKKFRSECRVIKKKIQIAIILNAYCYRQGETSRLRSIFA